MNGAGDKLLLFILSPKDTQFLRLLSDILFIFLVNFNPYVNIIVNLSLAFFLIIINIGKI